MQSLNSGAQQPLNPTGRYEFSSYTASGLPYEGEFEISGVPGEYRGFARTPVLPTVHFTEVLVVGQRITALLDVPGGLAVVSLEASNDIFVGTWQLGASRQPIRAVKTT
jgi:hypothetical protein